MLATWRHRTTHTTEYLLPANAPIGEFMKAYWVAWAQYCNSKGIDQHTTKPSDDWARIDHDDEHVIIRYETTKDAA